MYKRQTKRKSGSGNFARIQGLAATPSFTARTKNVSTRPCRLAFAQRYSFLLTILCFALTGVVALGADAIETAGDALQYVLPATAAGLTLYHRDREGALQFGESLGVTLGVTYALKYTVNETRPNGGSQSFPSGHTSLSFSSAEFMRKRYGWEYGIPAYAAASFVAYSRVESRAHHPHDVIAGAGIGIISSYIFTKPYKGWKVDADVGEGYYGIKLSRAW